MSKSINVPKLRFKAFSGEWGRKLFCDIVTNKSKKYNPEKESISYKCIELEHLSTESGQLLGYVDSLNLGSIKNKFNKNDVLFGKLRPYLKKYLLAPFDGVCSSEIWVLNGINVTNYFLYYIVQSDYFIGLANQSSGSKMPRADWNIIENSIFFIPSKQEQEKIASFLASVDTKIEQLTKKEELLQQYKKGVMQKIFNQEIRFKADDGSNFCDWEEKKLGEIANITIGEFVIKTKQNPDALYPVYNGGKTNTGFYNEYNNEGNQIIISARGANAGFVNFEVRRYWAGNSCYSISMIDNSFYNINFYYYYIKHFENKFTDFQQAANIPSVSKKEVNDFKVITLKIEEQNKIANFLSSIDTKIQQTQKQLESSKEFKKALLQQMFV